MATRPQIETRIVGLEAARAALERIVQAEIGAIPDALALVGQQAVTEIQRRAPVQTGRLRRSYTYDVDPGGRWVDIGTNVEYAPYQEFGTYAIAGTPHVRPGIEATIVQVPALMAEHLARAGRGAGGGLGGGLGATLSRFVNLP